MFQLVSLLVEFGFGIPNVHHIIFFRWASAPHRSGIRTSILFSNLWIMCCCGLSSAPVLLLALVRGKLGMLGETSEIPL